MFLVFPIFAPARGMVSTHPPRGKGLGSLRDCERYRPLSELYPNTDAHNIGSIRKQSTLILGGFAQP